MAKSRDTHYIDVWVVQKDGTMKKVQKEVDGLKDSYKGATKEGENYRKEMGAGGNQSLNTTKSFAKQAQGLGGLVHAYATVAANAFALTAAFSALQRAADLSILKRSMDILDQSSGTNLAGMSKALKDAAAGMITYEEAARNAAIVSAAGFGTKEMVELGKAARATSQALGRDFGDSLDRLVRGVIKAEPELLDELGIILRLDDATGAYAKTVNKTREQLTTAERQMAIYNSVLEQATDKYGAIIEAQDNANQFTLLQANSTELLNSALENLAHKLEPIVGYLNANGDALQGFLTIMGVMLARKALPLFGEMGRAMESWSEKADKALEAQQIRVSGLVRKVNDLKKAQERVNSSGTFDALISKYRGEGRLSATIEKEVIKGFAGQKLRDSIKRSLSQSVSAGLKAVDPATGVVGGRGMFAGQTTADIEKFKAAMLDADKTTSKIQQSALQRMSALAALSGAKASAAASSYGRDAKEALSDFGRGWKEANNQIASGTALTKVYSNVLAATATNAGIATTSLGGLRVMMLSVGVTAKFVGSMLVTMLNAFTLIFVAAQAFMFLKDLWTDEKVKKYNNALEKVEGSLESIALSSDKFIDSQNKASNIQSKNIKDALKRVELLKNSYTQLGDTVSTTFNDLDMVVVAKAQLEDIEGQIESAQRHLANTGKGQEYAVNRLHTEARIFALRQQTIFLNKDELAGVRKLIKANKFATSEFEKAQSTQGTVGAALLETLNKIKEGTEDISRESWDAFAKKYPEALTLAKFATLNLENSLKALNLQASDFGKTLSDALVPSDSKLQSISDKLRAAYSNVNEILSNPTSDDDTKRVALKDLGKIGSTLGLKQAGEGLTGAALKDYIEQFRDKIDITFKAVKKSVDEAAGSLDKISGTRVSDKVLKSSAASLAAIRKVIEKDTDSARKKDKIRSLNLEILNDNIEISKQASEASKLARQNEGKLDVTLKQRRSTEDAILKIQRQGEDLRAGLVKSFDQLTEAEVSRLSAAEKTVYLERQQEDLVTQRKRALEDIAAKYSKIRQDAEATAAAQALSYAAESGRLNFLSRKAGIQESSAPGLSKGDRTEASFGLKRQQLEASQANAKLVLLGKERALRQDIAKVQETAEANEGIFRDEDINKLIQAGNSINLVNQELANLKLSGAQEFQLISLEQQEAMLEFPKTWAEAWDNAATKMTNSMVDIRAVGMQGIIEGTRTFGDGLVDMVVDMDVSREAFKALARSIIVDLGSMIAKQLMFNALSGMMGGGNPLAALGSGSNRADYSYAGSNGAFGIPQLANGGILTKPTLALAAEAGMNEAFVPLPDGKTIPVTMTGSGGGGTNNNVVVNVNVSSTGATSDTQGDTTQAKKLGRLVSEAVKRELVEQKRPGGILNR